MESPFLSVSDSGTVIFSLEHLGDDLGLRLVVESREQFQELPGRTVQRGRQRARRLAEQVGHRAAEVLRKQLDALDGWDASATRDLTQETFSRAAFGTGDRWLDAFPFTVLFYILHKNICFHCAHLQL